MKLSVIFITAVFLASFMAVNGELEINSYNCYIYQDDAFSLGWMGEEDYFSFSSSCGYMYLESFSDIVTGMQNNGFHNIYILFVSLFSFGVIAASVLTYQV